MTFHKSIVFLFFIFSFFTLSVRAQQDPSIIGLGGFVVPDNSFDEKGLIGFTSISLDSPLLTNSKYELKGGLQFIGATTGVRGGYFALGYKADINLNPSNKFQPGIGVSFLAGGGNKTRVYDGFMIQGTAFAQYQKSPSLKFRAGVVYSYVSGGVVKGWSPTLGVFWDFNPSLRDTANNPTFFEWKTVKGEIGIGKYANRKLAFIGAGASWQVGKRLAGEFTIHSLANLYGGYMQVLSATGIKIGSNRFNLVPAVVLGLAGGGGAEVGGGAMTGLQCSSELNINNTSLGLKYQFVKALNGDFGYQGAFLSVGKNLDKKSESGIKYHPSIKFYTGSEGFGNIGLRIDILHWKLLSLMGSTYWAFTHDKGAYGEGFFELGIKAPYSIPLYAIGSIGAGAGAGINKETKALIKGISLGLNSPWKKIPLALEAGYWKGGNIPATSLSLIYKTKIK